MRCVPFRAAAYNEKGYTFSFRFEAPSWYGVEKQARKVLDKVIAGDKLHQKNGPWKIRGIDVGY